MKPRFGIVFAAVLASAPMFAYATTPIVYNVQYQSEGIVRLAGTITTDGKLGTLTTADIIGFNILIAPAGLPGEILVGSPLQDPGYYGTVQIVSTPVTATAQGLFYDTTNQEGALNFVPGPDGGPSVSLSSSGLQEPGASFPLSSNFEFATVGPPPPVAVPPIGFNANAEAITGEITNSPLGQPAVIRTLGADGTAVGFRWGTETSDAPEPSDSQTIFGVLIYNFQNLDAFAQSDYTPLVDDGIAETKTGEGSLLGGLVNWQSNDDRLTCQPAVSFPDRLQCASTETLAGLRINQVAVHAGKYPAGTSFPVTGSVNDTSCTTGQETFNGYLITQESQITGLGYAWVMLHLTGMHLIGDATCSSAKGAAFITHYDLAVAEEWFPNYSTTAASSPPSTAYAVQVR